MNRRALLSTIGVAALGGCAGLTADPEPTPSDTPSDSPTATARTTEPEQTPDEAADLEYVWRYDHGGWIDGVADGSVYCREHWIGEDSEGRVVALDAETGERQWDYGFADGYEFYSELLVEDAVYFGRGDDVINGGVGEVYALEFDGSERWTYPETSSVDRRPLLEDGVLYAAGSAGAVRAFDPADGEVLWENDDLPPARSMDNGVHAVGDVVFAKAKRLFGLDPGDGSILWSYGEEDVNWGPRVEVRENVAYVRSDERDAIVALASDGTEHWRRDLDVSGMYVADDRVVVESFGEEAALHGLDAGSGDDRWTIEDFGARVRAVTDDTAYVITERDDEVRAFAVADGTETWRASVADEPLSRVHGVADGPVFVETDADALYRVTRDGEVTSSYAFEDPIEDVAVLDDVYVGTIGSIYRLPAG